MEQDLQDTFAILRAELSSYEQAPMIAKIDRPGRYDLWSKKEVILNNKERDEIYFAGIIIQSTYVGFYFMPVYTNPETRELFSPELLGLLKGKSCFHIKKMSPELTESVRNALAIGYELYKERQWV
jgi:hypothetical protein